MAIPAAILRAQRAALFGLGSDQYTYAPRASYDAGFAIYSGPGTALGADLAPYDLNTPGVVSELKRALFVLGQSESDPFKKSGADVATEQTWKLLHDDDTWDGPTAEEFLLAVSRYRGLGFQIGAPYVQMGLQGGPPQPAVNGLELIAGAVHQRLGGAPAMARYEAWRAQGCLLQATCMAPPSAISKPPDGTPVTLTTLGPRIVAPATADPVALAKLGALDAQQQTLWQLALMAPTEAQRAQLAAAMATIRAARDAAALDAQASNTDRTQELACTARGGVWSQGPQTCALPPPVFPGSPVPPGPGPLPGPGAAPPPAQASMVAPIALLIAGAVGLWWVTKKKGAR